MHCCSSKTKKKIMIIFFVLGILVIIIFLHRLKGEYVLLSKRNEDNEDGGNQKWIEKCTMYENQSTVLSKEVLTYITSCTSKTEKNCEHNEQRGLVYVNKTSVSMEEIKNELTEVKIGGWWLPASCKETRNVAIIVPFKNREDHLPIFLRHLHPILQQQQLHYRIFVVEQVDSSLFNRGKLMNVGFQEAQKIFPYDCFVFHDVDLLPENDKISYGCMNSPQHLCVAIDKFNYQLPYEELFGGVEMFSKDDFVLVNGFSNSFWGWGAEDDNLYKRLAWKNLKLHRQPINISRYQMLQHTDNEPNANPNRYAIREASYKHFETDGLTKLKYKIIEIQEEPLFTHVQVDLQREIDIMFGLSK